MAVLNRNGSSGNVVKSQALKLCVLKDALFLQPLSFPLENHGCCVSWQTSRVPRCFIESFQAHPELSFDFIYLSQEQEGVCHLPGAGGCVPSLSGAAPGTALTQVSLCFLISHQGF